MYLESSHFLHVSMFKTSSFVAVCVCFQCGDDAPLSATRMLGEVSRFSS